MWEPSHESATFSNWAGTEPNGGMRENFAHLNNNASSRTWNDCPNEKCYNPVNALCQITL